MRHWKEAKILFFVLAVPAAATVLVYGGHWLFTQFFWTGDTLLEAMHEYAGVM